MDITLRKYLENPSEFPDTQLSEINKNFIFPEKFKVAGIKHLVLKNVKKFYGAMGYTISDGDVDQTFHIDEGEKLIAVFSLIQLESDTSVLVNLVPWIKNQTIL